MMDYDVKGQSLRSLRAHTADRQHVEGDGRLDSSPHTVERAEAGAVPPPGVDEVKLLRKIDIRVMPMLFLIYVAAFLDR
jgi:hypothetical protein